MPSCRLSLGHDRQAVACLACLALNDDYCPKGVSLRALCPPQRLSRSLCAGDQGTRNLIIKERTHIPFLRFFENKLAFDTYTLNVP